MLSSFPAQSICWREKPVEIQSKFASLTSSVIASKHFLQNTLQWWIFLTGIEFENRRHRFKKNDSSERRITMIPWRILVRDEFGAMLFYGWRRKLRGERRMTISRRETIDSVSEGFDFTTMRVSEGLGFLFYVFVWERKRVWSGPPIRISIYFLNSRFFFEFIDFKICLSISILFYMSKKKFFLNKIKICQKYIRFILTIYITIWSKQILKKKKKTFQVFQIFKF